VEDVYTWMKMKLHSADHQVRNQHLSPNTPFSPLPQHPLSSLPACLPLPYLDEHEAALRRPPGEEPTPLPKHPLLPSPPTPAVFSSCLPPPFPTWMNMKLHSADHQVRNQLPLPACLPASPPPAPTSPPSLPPCPFLLCLLWVFRTRPPRRSGTSHRLLILLNPNLLLLFLTLCAIRTRVTSPE